MSADDRMLKLMAYADGELEGAELAEVEAWMAEDAKAVRFANELADLGDLVKMGHAESSAAKAVLSFDVTDAVMAKVNSEKAGGNEGIEAEKPRAKVAAPVASLDAARARRNLKVGSVVAAALALAASVFLMTRSKEEQPMARAPVPAVQPSPVASNGNGPGVDVDIVETPGHSVSVFYLPNESSLTTTSVVVWVDESGGK